MTSSEIRFKCRTQYREEGHLDMPDSIRGSTEHRMVWNDEAMIIVTEALKCAGGEHG